MHRDRGMPDGGTYAAWMPLRCRAALCQYAATVGTIWETTDRAGERFFRVKWPSSFGACCSRQVPQ